MQLFTIGYEKTGQGALIDCLRRAGVRLLIDVRELPLSRRAGFSKTPLSAACHEAGIDYLHLRALGTPKDGRQANRNHDWPAFWSITETALARPEAQYELGVAGAQAQVRPACLICFEHDPAVCHRQRVAERLAQGWGLQVTHLAADAAF